jgi:hypothetical protein
MRGNRRHEPERRRRLLGFVSAARASRRSCPSTWAAIFVHNMFMRPYRAAWVIVGMLALAAVSFILASIFGAHVILLAIGTGLATFFAAGVAGALQGGHYEKLRVEKNRKRELEAQKEFERKRERRSLDRDCLELLERAEDAVSAIVNSDARSQNLLNTYVDEELLRDNIHTVEIVAKKITALRAKHRSITAMSAKEPYTGEQLFLHMQSTALDETEKTGPMTAAVIGPQRRAIETALRSAKSRVENLERYAASVKAVDATYRDWIGAQHAEGLNESVRDLLANTVKDELAVEELRTLTERTAQAKEAFQESVRKASLAAETLSLPDEKDS